jgi:sugar phosphate isomerase/epimerase
MKYSITLASFRKIEPIEKTLCRLAEQGYDAVEMYGEPEMDVMKLRDALSTGGLPVCGITGMWGRASAEGWKRRLLSADLGIATASEKYVNDCIRMCSDLGGSEINVCLFGDDDAAFDGNHHGTMSPEQKSRISKIAAPVLGRLCKEAADSGVRLLLEPLNRYSTPYCATTRDAIFVARQVDGLGVLLDTFHMNIEEDSLEEAIFSCKGLLGHMHIADNNRKMPGFGHIDFKLVVRGLVKIEYSDYLSFEPSIADGNYASHTKAGLDHVRKIEYATQYVSLA